ncbi:MAG: GNAT family N-acetyltransferase [Bacteroidia bacterium]
MAFSLDQVAISNHPDKKRFEARLGADVAVVEYMLTPDKIVFTHTEVPEAFEGQGVGGKLARTALDWARAEGKMVLPLCPFIRSFVRRHAEYQDLVMPGFIL